MTFLGGAVVMAYSRGVVGRLEAPLRNMATVQLSYVYQRRDVTVVQWP